MRKRFYIYLGLLLLVGIVSIVLKNLLPPPNEQSLIDFVSYYGSIASVFGILVTLVELYYTEKIARDSSELARRKINSIVQKEIHNLILTSINKCDSVRQHLEHDEIEDVIRKGQELIDGMNILKGDQNIGINRDTKQLLILQITKTRMDVHTLVRIKDKGQEYEKSKMINNFVDLREQLNLMDQEMKNIERNEL